MQSFNLTADTQVTLLQFPAQVYLQKQTLVKEKK